MKALIIEDVKFSCLLMKHFFESQGYQAIIATSGFDALQLLKSNTGDPVDVVVTDLNLPDIDGFEVLRRYRESEMQKSFPGGMLPPFVMLTGSQDKDDLKRAESLGFAAILEKPFNPEVMKTVLATLAATSEEGVAQDGAWDESSFDSARKYVLVVDDIGFHSLMSQNILKRTEAFLNDDYKILTTSYGYEALQLLKSSPAIEMVVCDLSLPDINGFELYRQYREWNAARNNGKTTDESERGPAFVLVTTSADADKVDPIMAKTLGFGGVFTKPLNPAECLPILNALLLDKELNEAH